MPLMVPSLTKARPAGRTEAAVCPGNSASVQVYGGVPPVAWSFVVYGVIVTALGRLVVVTVNGVTGPPPPVLPPPQPRSVSAGNKVAASKHHLVAGPVTSFGAF